jgi:hypothetical protein
VPQGIPFSQLRVCLWGGKKEKWWGRKQINWEMTYRPHINKDAIITYLPLWTPGHE